MNIRYLVFSGLALGLTLPGTALANPSMAGGGMGRGAEASFERMDTNKDGKATREEFFAAFPQMKDGAFTSIDVDGDGVISKEEWLTFSKGHAVDESAAHPDGAGRPPMMRNANGTGHPPMMMPKDGAKHPPMRGMNGTDQGRPDEPGRPPRDADGAGAKHPPRQGNGTAPGQAPDLIMPSK